MQGEPGIGKTAIVEAFLHSLRASADGVLIGYGQCVEQHGEREPYMPALEALERLSHGPARDRLLLHAARRRPELAGADALASARRRRGAARAPGHRHDAPPHAA